MVRFEASLATNEKLGKVDRRAKCRSAALADIGECRTAPKVTPSDQCRLFASPRT
jgi:hypothetical protein